MCALPASGFPGLCGSSGRSPASIHQADAGSGGIRERHLCLRHVRIVNVNVLTKRFQGSRSQCVFFTDTDTLYTLGAVTSSKPLKSQWSSWFTSEKTGIHGEERELICVQSLQDDEQDILPITLIEVKWRVQKYTIDQWPSQHLRPVWLESHVLAVTWERPRLQSFTYYPHDLCQNLVPCTLPFPQRQVA